MRIVHVASGDLWAGAEVSVSHVVREIAARPGCRVRAILLNDGVLAATLAGAGVTIDVLPERSRGLRDLAASVVSIARGFGADVVHTHRYKEDLLGAWTAGRTGALHVRTAHGRPPSPGWRSGPVGLGGWIDGIVADWTGSVWIAVSEDLAESLRGLRRSVHVVPNGIPSKPPEPARDQLLAACGVRDAILVGFVGRLEEVKRPDRFLRVVRRLPSTADGVPVAAVIVGAGSMRDAVVAALGARDGGPRAVLLDPVPHGERLVASLDVLVVPSDHEGLPMVVLEAMRSSVAVAGTAVGGMPEVIGPGPWLVPVDDETALADRVTDLVRDATVRRAWGAALRARFAGTFTIEGTVDRILDVYRSEARAAGRSVASHEEDR